MGFMCALKCFCMCTAACVYCIGICVSVPTDTIVSEYWSGSGLDKVLGFGKPGSDNWSVCVCVRERGMNFELVCRPVL